MIEILISVGAFLLAIGILVTFHEFGHFWVARRLGVRVLRFSVGFGRILWSRRGRDGTEYAVSAVPLGGYVKMLDERETEVPEDERHQAFNRQPLYKRSAIVAAGPVFNFIFAIFAYWAVFMLGTPGLKPVVGEVAAESPAAVAGVESGDRITAVNDDPVATWAETNLELIDALVGSGGAELRVARDGREKALSLRVADARSLTEPGRLLDGLGIAPWRPGGPAQVREVIDGSAADRAGLRKGDRILAVDDARIAEGNGPRELGEAVKKRAGETVTLRVASEDGATRRVRVRLDTRRTESGEEIGRLGVMSSLPPDVMDDVYTVRREAVLPAFGSATVKTGEMSVLTLKLLGRMLVGDVSLKNISGPVRIAEYAGYTATAGLVSFLSFLAVISVSLGVLNLLPIPVLDGGHLLYQVAELLMGRPVSERVEIIGQQIGIVLIVLLMGLALYNDLAHLFH